MHIQNKAVPLQPQLRTRFRAFSSAGSEHLPYKQRVGGSNPSTPTQRISRKSLLFLFGAFSSAGSEHLPYKQRVGGSNPSTPTIEKIVWFPDSLFLFRNQRVYPRFQKLFQSKLTSLQFPISSATRGQRSDDLTRTYQVLLYTSR